MASVSSKVTKEVTLTLTEREAAILLKVLNHVGGDPVHSPRKVCDTISQGLKREVWNKERWESIPEAEIYTLDGTCSFR